MLSKTSRKDVAKDKASELVSAATDAAEAGRDKLAPVVENVTTQLSEAADKATDAAAPHVAKAKEAVAEAAAPHVAKAKEAATDASDTAAPRVAEVKKKAEKQAKKAKKEARKRADKASDSAAGATPNVEKANRKAKKAARKAAKAAGPQVTRAKEQATEAAGLTSEQARHLFNDELMPRVHEAIAAAGAAGGSAYAALPQRARDTLDVVAPEVVKKRRKKGTVLIALGLLAGAGAVALLVSGKQQENATKTAPKLPEVERLDVQDAEDAPALSSSDDAVGDLEKKADAAVSGSRRGRHAAQE